MMSSSERTSATTWASPSSLVSYLPLSSYSHSLGFLSFLALFFLPETPKFLVSRGKIGQAEDSVAFYHGASADVEETVKIIQHVSVLPVLVNESCL